MLVPLEQAKFQLHNSKSRANAYLDFVVVIEDFKPLLGSDPLKNLPSISINCDLFVNNVSNSEITDKYYAVFDGILDNFMGLAF